LALRAGGDAAGAVAALERASGSGSSSIELRARMELEFVRLLEDREVPDSDLIALATAAIPTFETLNDDRSLGRAWLLTGFVHGARHMRCKTWERSAEKALVHYRRAGWPAATCLGQLANALYHGPVPASEAAKRCEELLVEYGLGPADEANLAVFLGGLRAMLGDTEAGRRLVARARETFDELGQTGLVAALCGMVGGEIESLAGDYASAEQTLLESCELLASLRLESTFSTRAGELAAAIYAQGRYDEAAEWLRKAQRTASGGDLDARSAWQPVQAKLLARDGQHEQAQQLAFEALSAARTTDALNQRARVLIDVAEVFRLGGQEQSGVAFTDEARRTYEEKGNRAALERLAAPAARKA
jgi:tetratricopeptide (TPR) repeat protein